MVRSGICMWVDVDCLSVGLWVGDQESIWLSAEVGDSKSRPRWVVWVLVLVKNLTTVLVAGSSEKLS